MHLDEEAGAGCAGPRSWKPRTPRMRRDRSRADLGDERRVRLPVHQRVPGLRARCERAPSTRISAGAERDHRIEPERARNAARPGQRHHRPDRRQQVRRIVQPVGGDDARSGRAGRRAPARAPAQRHRDRQGHDRDAPAASAPSGRGVGSRPIAVQPISAAEAGDQQRLAEGDEVLDASCGRSVVLVRRPGGIEDAREPGGRSEQVERGIGQRGSPPPTGLRSRPAPRASAPPRTSAVADRGEAGRQVQALRGVHRTPEGPCLSPAVGGIGPANSDRRKHGAWRTGAS